MALKFVIYNTDTGRNILGGNANFEYTPALWTEHDSNYLYFGFDETPWRVKRYLRSDPSITSTADEGLNPAILTLAEARASVTTLVYA